jgi:hypothetical protein
LGGSGDMKKIKREPSRLAKRVKRGFRGYPLATVAFYGEDAARKFVAPAARRHASWCASDEVGAEVGSRDIRIEQMVKDARVYDNAVYSALSID